LLQIIMYAAPHAAAAGTPAWRAVSTSNTLSTLFVVLYHQLAFE
jgi:hypothetical protein